MGEWYEDLRQKSGLQLGLGEGESSVDSTTVPVFYLDFLACRQNCSKSIRKPPPSSRVSTQRQASDLLCEMLRVVLSIG